MGTAVYLVLALAFVSPQDSSLAQFEILRARFYKQEGVLGLEPVIQLTVRNGTPYAVSRAYFEGTLQSPGRSIPWLKETFNYEISGGIEPGEQQTWRLAPSSYSEWGRVEAPASATLTVEVTRLDGADGERLFREERPSIGAADLSEFETTETAGTSVLGALGVIWIFALVLFILWLVLPVLVLMTNSRLRHVRSRIEDTNELLAQQGKIFVELRDLMLMQLSPELREQRRQERPSKPSS